MQLNANRMQAVGNEPEGREAVNEGYTIGENKIRNKEQPQAANPSDMLVELFELLEDYAPLWYTEQHHNRALAALRVLEGS
jgi:hypothetical protein